MTPSPNPTPAVPARRHRGRRARAATVLAIGVAIAVPASASAATDQFLRLGGDQYAGESLDKEYKGAFELESSTFNVKRSSATATAPTFGNLTITKRVDRASPALMLAAASGVQIPSARLSVRQAGSANTAGATYLEYCFQHVVVMTDQVNNNSGDDAPLETVTLSYRQITQSYTPQSTTGAQETPIVTGWDLVGTPISDFSSTCGQ